MVTACDPSGLAGRKTASCRAKAQERADVTFEQRSSRPPRPPRQGGDKVPAGGEAHEGIHDAFRISNPAVFEAMVRMARDSSLADKDVVAPRTRLLDRLARAWRGKHKIHKVSADGNCQFHALLQLLKGLCDRGLCRTVVSLFNVTIHHVTSLESAAAGAISIGLRSFAICRCSIHHLTFQSLHAHGGGSRCAQWHEGARRSHADG